MPHHHPFPQLADQRSGRVVFLSHCLLNQHTRYLGGACRSCCVQEIVQQCIALDLSMIQMPCPEELAWGGVLKRRFLQLYGLSRRWHLPGFAMAALAEVAGVLTRHQARRLARRVAQQIQDYSAAGWQVVGIVGVDGSPSCGVRQTVGLRAAVAAFAALDPATLTREAQNATISALVEPGNGLFITALRAAMAKRGLDVPILGHDLMAELRGETSPLDLETALGEA
ncbi:2-thiouracil desulfurase family protein [Marimonas arenosa]|uniref:2-thiouracil desulfurase family protein n=1 Tax=Marimonas arenosa TaxID=1795305 RepID=A0AAE3WF68_9RHOB|nr:2-thiouracil desulfurase family protein [Marimonas arenosa]MDQ2091514.1 2-thiouracil desulfurase family protein [Marimonas arenosa]